MAEQHTYSRTHQLEGDVLHFDLAGKARGILDAARESDSGRAAETLAKEGPLRIVILGFTAGSLMHNHRAGGPASIQVLDGLITVKTADDSTDVGRAEALVIEAGVAHSVVAKTDSVILLSIAMTEPEE